jgi:DNA polymerase elongation subunit (family B)
MIRKRLTQYPQDYRRASHVAVAAQSLAARGVDLRPGEMVEYVITQADSALPCERARPFTMLDGWHHYDRSKYLELLEKAFLPFSLYCSPRHSEPVLSNSEGQSEHLLAKAPASPFSS